MIYAFKRRRIFQACGCLALAAMASAFLVMGLLGPADPPFFKWAALSAATLFYAILIPVLQETFTPGPILTIGPEGLTYQPFSLQPIPWAELQTVQRLRSKPEPGKSVDPKRDGVRFAVRDLSRIALRRGFGGAMMATQRVMFARGAQIDATQADADEIVAAIQTYWPGEISIVTVSASVAL